MLPLAVFQELFGALSPRHGFLLWEPQVHHQWMVAVCVVWFQEDGREESACTSLYRLFRQYWYIAGSGPEGKEVGVIVSKWDVRLKVRRQTLGVSAWPSELWENSSKNSLELGMSVLVYESFHGCESRQLELLFFLLVSQGKSAQRQSSLKTQSLPMWTLEQRRSRLWAGQRKLSPLAVSFLNTAWLDLRTNCPSKSTFSL